MSPLLLAPVLALAAACSTAGARVPPDLPPAPAPSPETEVARLVGDLLSSDEAASEAAGAALARSDPAHRKALAEVARRIPSERDPRWRGVLDQCGLLGDLAPAERLDLLLWQASRTSPVVSVKAQSGLLDIAKSDPSPLLARLKAPGPSRDAIAVALAGANDRRAIPALVDLYRGPATDAERRAAATALGRLAGDAVAPRPDGSKAQREADAARIVAWYERAGGDADGSK